MNLAKQCEVQRRVGFRAGGRLSDADTPKQPGSVTCHCAAKGGVTYCQGGVTPIGPVLTTATAVKEFDRSKIALTA